jgi:DNA-binding response OmpR family regulator
MTVNTATVRSDSTLIVADSDVLERMSIAAYLRDCGYRVIEAADSDEAIAILSEEDIEVDVVLADLAISGSLNGFKLAGWIREQRNGIHVVLAGSAANTANAAANLCEEGPMMAKPYDPQLIVDRIRRFIAERGRNRPVESCPPLAFTSAQPVPA